MTDLNWRDTEEDSAKEILFRHLTHEFPNLRAKDIWIIGSDGSIESGHYRCWAVFPPYEDERIYKVERDSPINPPLVTVYYRYGSPKRV